MRGEWYETWRDYKWNLAGFETALKTMSADGIEYAELQFIWDTEICHHTGEQNAEMKRFWRNTGYASRAL